MIWADAKVVAFDLETSGTLPEYALQPWRVATGDSWITSISIIRRQGDQLVPDGSKLFPDRQDIRDFVVRIIAAGWTVVGWNIAFDISWLIAYGCGDLVHKIKWLDGMLVMKHLFVEPEYELDRSKKRSYGLKAAVAEHLPAHAGYADDVDFHSTDPDELAKLQKYNDRDSVYTWVLTKLFWEDLSPEQQRAVAIEAESLSLIAEANFTGMPVDGLAAKELAQWLEDTAAAMLEKLEPHGVTEKVVRSPKQLEALLFDQWGLPVLKENTGAKTGKTSRSTDKEVLHELAFQDERCADLRAYREALNNRTKFADSPYLAGHYNGDGCARPAAICFGTYSGRLTYASKQGRNKDERQTGFALHQEKRDENYRAIITAPEGYTLVEFDASGQEFRWMAILANDPVMLNLCLPGEDPHSYMGSRIVNVDYAVMRRLVDEKDKKAKDDRQLGKVANLSLQYRTYPKTLRKVARVQYNIPMELPEAQRIHRTYQQTYTKVPRYWERSVQMVKRQGYVETLAGRRVQVTGNWGGPLGWSMESTAINYPVQGTGADQKYLALKVIKAYLSTIGARFAWDLHDGIYLWVPDAMVTRAVADIRALLNDLPYPREWGFCPPIPLPWDCKVGKSWGALKEWKE
jgi:DNA polymerase-1